MALKDQQKSSEKSQAELAAAQKPPKAPSAWEQVLAKLSPETLQVMNPAVPYEARNGTSGLKSERTSR